jgi:UDP-glucuronate 4-epimerase
MNILVTGAAGFIGYHVVGALLARGETVIGIDNLNSYYNPQLKRSRLAELRRVDGDFEFLELDFSDWSKLDTALAQFQIDRIVHLGAQAGVRHSIENPHLYATANLVGHLNLLELARQRRVVHCVYASSSSVYGGNDRLPFNVQDRVDHPVSLYAATKKADELMSESYAHLYRIPMSGLRFFTVYGPWGRPDMAIWIFTKMILAGEPIPVFNAGKMKRDFTYVKDIVAGVVSCLDRPPADDDRLKPGGSRAPHNLYNLGNGEPAELSAVISLIEGACGRKATWSPHPMQPGDVCATFADISESRRDLGFEPRTRIEQGIPRFVDWFKKSKAERI